MKSKNAGARVVANFALVLISLLIAGCASNSTIEAGVRSQLAPSGTLRVGLNVSNTSLVRRNPSGGEPAGVASDIARELARRVGVPVRFVSYDSGGKLGSSIGSGEWDITFFAIEAARANQVDFSPPYAQIETTYLVQNGMNGTPFRNAGDVDKDNVVIAVLRGAGFESALASGLKRAKLLRIASFNAGIEALVQKKATALSGLKPDLNDYAEKNPDFRVLDGRFATVEQAIGVQKGRERAARYVAEFVRDIRQSGFVANVIAANDARGLIVQ